MKNIALVVSDFDCPDVKKNLSSLYPKLNEKYKVTVVAFTGTPSEEYEGSLETLDIPAAKDGFFSTLLCNLKRIFALRKIAKEKNLRLFASLSEDSNLPVAYSYLSVKKSIYCTSLESYNLNAKKYVKMLKHADAVLARNMQVGNLFKEQHPGVANKIKVVETPIDTAKISELSKEALPEEHTAFFKNGNVIAVSGPFTYKRGHWNILKAFGVLKENYKKAKLVFVGSGGDYEEAIKRMTEQNELKKDILFVNETENPYRYIAASKGYVQADIQDGGQVYLLEAMATGTPVAATDCMTRNILFEKPDPEFKCDKMTFADNGIITPAFDKREDFVYSSTYSAHIDLANAMKELLVSEKIPELLKENALKSIEKYSSEKILKSYVEFIDKLYLCL